MHLSQNPRIPPWSNIQLGQKNGREAFAELGRSFVAIDMANLAYMLKKGARNGQNELDYQQFLTWLVAGRSLTSARIYTGLDTSKPEIRAFFARLASFGYEVLVVQGKTYKDGTKKRPNADVMIVTDLLSRVGEYDEATLVSGDGDFAYPVRELLRMGKRVRIISTRDHLARALRESGADVCYLDQELDALLMTKM